MEKKKMHPAWLMFIACCLVQIGGLGTIINSIGIMLPSVMIDLQFAQGPFMLYMTIQSVVMAFSMPIAGRLMAKVNIRVLLTGAAIICAGAYAAMGTFNEIWQWYIAGAIIGASGFFCFLVAPVVISNWFAAKTGLVMGITMACSSVMGAIINPVGQMLIANFGWRSTYMILAVVALCFILPVSLFVIRFKPADMGLAPYGADAAAVAAAASSGPNSAPAAVEGVAQKTALKSLSFVCLFLLAGIIALVSSLLQLLPTIASMANMTAIAATLSSTAMIGGLVGKFGFGWLKDVMGARNCTYIGFVFGVISIGLFVFSIMNMNAVTMFVAAALFGAFTAMGPVNNPLIVGEAYGMKDYAGIFSYITLGTTLIGGLGMTAIGVSYDMFGSYYPAMYAMIGFCVLGVVCLTVGLASAKKLPREAGA